MSLKDILVHVTGEDGDAATVGVAVALAGRFQARLTGLFARADSSASAAVAHMPSDHLKAAAAQAEAAFRLQCAQADVAEPRWWMVSHGGKADLLAEAVFCTFFADLVVVGRGAARGQGVPDSFVEDLIVKAGRPVVMVPESVAGPDIGRRVAVGWRAGREAARAVHDSMSFLEQADSTVVITIGPRTHSPDFLPPANILDHLHAHGVAAIGEQIQIEDLGAMDALLSRAYDHDCDLLVVGAHSGLSLPLGRGSSTRHLLRHAALPVLFSH